MANLVRWSVGMSLPKKKEENQLSSGLTISSLRNPVQFNQTVNNQIKTTQAAGSNVSGGNSGNFSANNNFQVQQNNFQQQQAEQLRRQQEEQQRQQRIEQMRQQQEERRQQEQEKRLQQQQELQQKQQRLLNSSLTGASVLNSTSVGDRSSGLQRGSNRSGLLATLGAQNNLERRMNPTKTESDINYDNWLRTTSMDNLANEIKKARANNDTDWIRRIQQYSGKNTNDFDTYIKQTSLQNSELNLGRSAATTLRDVNDTKTYGSLDTNDNDNMRYFGRQNLLKKTFKAALGDNADVSNMSYRDMVNAYNNASGDQQADIKKAIADEIVDQREYAKKGNDEALKSASYLADLNMLLNEYGIDKGKSFGKQIGDWLTTGGFIGNIGGNALTEALGNMSGDEDAVKAHLEKQQNTRTDLGAIGAVDSALTAVANTGLNLGTGGWYGLANAGLGVGNAVGGLDDKVLDFDDYGNASLRNKETGEQLSELGSAALNAGFALAGKAGIGPALGRGTLKDLAKYAVFEPAWAGGTTAIQEGLGNLGKGKGFFDYDWNKVGGSFMANLGQDIGMDLFNLGQGRARAKVETQAANNLQNRRIGQLEDGTMVKVGADGTVTKLTDAELAKAITTGTVDNNMDGILNNTPKDNNMDGVVSRKVKKAANGLDSLGKMVTGQNQRLAYAGADSGAYRDTNSSSLNDTNRSYTVIKGGAPDGSNLVKTDYNLPENSSIKNVSKAIKDIIRNRFMGKSYKVGETDVNAKITGRTKNELSYKQGNMSESDFVKKGSMSGNLDELIENMSNVRKVPNRKPNAKPNVDHYISGTVAVDLGDGKIYTPRVDVEVNKKGQAIGYDIANIKESSTYHLDDQPQVRKTRIQGRTSSISQNTDNVNNGITKLADMGYDVSKDVQKKTKNWVKKHGHVGLSLEITGLGEDGGKTGKTGKTDKRKVLNLSGLEDPNAKAIKSGKKMTTQEFFDANKIKSNDLSAMKQNYPNEIKSVKKLISAGVTPENFNSKILNSDGSVKKAYKGQDIPAIRAMFEMSYNYNKATDAGAVKDQKKANIFGEDVIKENTTRKSSLADKMSRNQAFSEETRNALANDPVTYKPTTNEERLARANEILSSKSIDEVDSYLRDNYFNTADKNRNSGDTVLAGEFAKMLDADGQYGRATEVVQKMSEIATKQGQQIQALSIMANRSPEGIANMAQTAIQKGGGKVDGELRKQILSNTQEIGKTRAKRAALTTENDDITYKIMNGIGDLPALRKRQMEIAQEYRTCLDQEGRDFAKLAETVSSNSPRDKSIFGSVWRAGLLSGPRTHVGNAVSNTFQNALNAGADRIAAGIDWARSKVTGGEREVVSSAGGRGKGLKRGLSAAGEVMKTGTNLWEGTEKVTSNQPNAWGYGGELAFKNKVADTMVAKPTNYVFRAMSAGDLPFRYAAFENAIRTEAKRQGMNQGYKGQALQDYINSRVATPDPDLQAYGIKKGNESVYDADTFLSRTMSSLDKQINKIDNKVGRNVAKTAKTLIAPFVKVPSKVLSTAVDYSPMGAVKAIVKKVGGSKNYTTGQFETDIARSGLGSGAFVGLGYALSSAGLLTGGYPEDNDERNRWKAEGIEPNSIKIGDKYVSLNYLGPAAILMGMGAGVQKRQEKGEDPFTVAVGSIGDTFNAFFEQSYVQGLNSAINAVKDSQRYGESYANSLARGLVPNLLRQTAVATDSKQRQVDNPIEAITSGIPGLSQTLDAKVDTYGQEIENKQTLPLGQMWDALKISNSRKTNAVIDEVSRLHSVDPSNKDLQVTPPVQSGTISVNGTNVKLTDDQKTQLQKDTGAAALLAMQQVMDSPKYQTLSDAEKATALDKARSDAQKQARKQFIETNNITADNNSGTRDSGGSVSGDYASKAITSATANTEGKSAITANSSIGQSSKDILDKYNSMSKEDWEKYLYGSSADSAAAEYNLAKAKYENDLANNKLTEAQKVKREKELRKLEVSKDWEKTYRDIYSLAGSKSDMQDYLNGLDDSTRAETVGILNGLNRAMYEAGVIQASTYKTRSNAINGTTTASSGSKGSKKGSSGISSAEASALASLAKTMVKNTNSTKSSTTKAPETQRRMTRTKSGNVGANLATYTPETKRISVTKGAKRSIA